MSASRVLSRGLGSVRSIPNSTSRHCSISRTYSSRIIPLVSRPRIIQPLRPYAVLPIPISRHFNTSQIQRHGHVTPPKPGEELYVTFIDKDDKDHRIAVSAGDNLLDIAQAHDLEMEGACGGSCACSTCHVIVTDEQFYDRMPEPEDDENDMLDLAFGLTETSRLGCQVVMTKELDGLKVKLPSMTRNLQASDFTQK
ncbi:adrenodoxin-like protein, mitochondrial precursor [Nemania sp. FL0916]|nr:adrenodoxin-like protein, mitochondrial precursor [Nemania sp. FL0916]